MLCVSLLTSLKSVLCHHLLQPSLSQRRRSASFTSTREAYAIDNASDNNKTMKPVEKVLVEDEMLL